MEDKALAKEFKSVTDTPTHIKDWIEHANEKRRSKASLDRKNEFGLPSGRHHAERVLKLKDKSQEEWTKTDETFGRRVVNYAKRSAGISTHHAHSEKSEVGDTGMTKNEIARRNWGLPARPKKTT